MGFGAYFLLVGYLAWETARQTTTAWFSVGATQATYQTYMIAAMLLLAALFIVAATPRRVTVIAGGSSADEFADDEAGLEGDDDAGDPGDLQAHVQWLDQEIEEEFDTLFTTLTGKQGAEGLEARRAARSRVSTATAPDPGAIATVVGPGIVAVLYVALAAIMLPASEVFLVYNFHLNTAILLGLSYGWVGLGLYALFAILRVLRSPGRRVPRPVLSLESLLPRDEDEA